MLKVNKMRGYDVDSKKVVIAVPKGEKYEFKEVLNTKASLEEYISSLESGSAHVVEATGAYSMQLCYLLYRKGMLVYLANPKGVKSFKEANLEIVKSDPKDALSIAQYGERLSLPLFKPKEEKVLLLDQRMKHVNNLKKELNAVGNRLKQREYLVSKDPLIQELMEKRVDQIEQEIELIESTVESLLGDLYGEVRQLVESVKGIGPKTACMLLFVTNGFTQFTEHKQVARYLGVCPRLASSGKMKERSLGLCRTSVPYFRGLLYMAALSAKKWNRNCRALYERLRAKGKSHKTAMIAVGNKLIKQVCAVVRTGQEYNNDFVPNYKAKG